MSDLLWYTSPTFLAATAVACVLQLIILRKLPEGGHVTRTHAGLAAFGIGLTLLGHFVPSLGPVGRVDVLTEAVIAGWGILFIRIVLIVLFRIAMPALGVGQPRILHEIVFVLFSLAWILVRLRTAGLNLGGIVTASAAITAIIAFSMQETLGNILGGLALQLDKSLHIGDWILVDGIRGQVVEVHWRHTALLTPNGEVVVLPNSLLMKGKMTIISSPSYPTARRAVHFSVSDRIAPQEVVQAIERALRGAAMKYVATSPLPDCVVHEFSGGNTEYAVRYWLTDQLHDAVADSTIRLHIYSALQRLEVALARPYLDVRVDPEANAAGEQVRERDIDARTKVLAGVPLFAGLQGEELGSLAKALRVTPFVKGAVMTRQGEVAHWLYVLIRGEADVWFDAPDSERRLVASLEAGAVFGEMGILTGAARTASVIARTDAECYRIDKASFEEILRARPELANELAQIMSERSSGLEAVRGEHASNPAEEELKLLEKMRRFFHLPSLG